MLALLPPIGALAVFSREREARLESLVELNRAYRGTALVLGDVVEADDGYTGEHSRGVVTLALAVGDRLGLDAPARRNLEFGALLHDVGKVAIPRRSSTSPAGSIRPSGARQDPRRRGTAHARPRRWLHAQRRAALLAIVETQAQGDAALAA